MATIQCLTSDLKPDSWTTFYLFYFNQGLGSDATFELPDRLIHIFVGNLMSSKNNEIILNVMREKSDIMAGEFVQILVELALYSNDLFLKSAAGAALMIDSKTGKARSVLFDEDEEIKAFVERARAFPGAKQLH